MSGEAAVVSGKAAVMSGKAAVVSGKAAVVSGEAAVRSGEVSVVRGNAPGVLGIGSAHSSGASVSLGFGRVHTAVAAGAEAFVAVAFGDGSVHLGNGPVHSGCGLLPLGRRGGVVVLFRVASSSDSGTTPGKVVYHVDRVTFPAYGAATNIRAYAVMEVQLDAAGSGRAAHCLRRDARFRAAAGFHARPSHLASNADFRHGKAPH